MFARRVDANHAEIKCAFEKFGCSVVDLSRVGNDVPDLLISLGYTKTALVEVKTEKGKMKKGQDEFRMKWKGRHYIARDLDDVVAIVNGLRA